MAAIPPLPSYGGDAGARSLGYSDLSAYNNAVAAQNSGSGLPSTPTTDFSAANNLLKQQATDTTNFNNNQSQQQNDFLTQYKNAVNGQETQSQAAARIGGSLGLPALQANSQALNNTLFNLPTTYGKATTGFDVNSNQLAQIIAQKQSELAPSATLAASNVQNAENNVTQQLGYESADQSKALLPLQEQGTMLSDQLAREYTGFTQDKQNQLQVVMQQIADGQQLTMQQLQAADTLAQQKEQYDNANTSISQGLMSVAPNNSLYDPSGNFIAQAPAARSSGGGGQVSDPLGLL